MAHLAFRAVANAPNSRQVIGTVVTWHTHRRAWRARGAGSGLGLRIAQGIARAHGGTLVAASTAGDGATFTLTIPAAVDGRPFSPT